jgi:hypothetical protein
VRLGPSATTLRSVGAARITSQAASRMRASPSLSQAITASPALGIRRAIAACATRRRTSTSGSPSAGGMSRSAISGGRSASRAAASRRSLTSPDVSAFSTCSGTLGQTNAPALPLCAAITANKSGAIQRRIVEKWRTRRA